MSTARRVTRFGWRRRPQIGGVTANILNNQMRIADKEWYTRLEGWTTAQRKFTPQNFNIMRRNTEPEIWYDTLLRDRVGSWTKGCSATSDFFVQSPKGNTNHACAIFQARISAFSWWKALQLGLLLAVTQYGECQVTSSEYDLITNRSRSGYARPSPGIWILLTS